MRPAHYSQEHVRFLPWREATILLTALGSDALGEPPLPLHPVVWYGKLIRALEAQAPQTPRFQLLYGLCMLLLASPAALLLAYFIEVSSNALRAMARKRGVLFLGELFSALIEGVSLKPFFALNMLILAGRCVRHALEHHDLPAARLALGQLVSRERSGLSEELAAAAAIESLAENVNDSVVAPLFYYALYGLRGAAAYRLFNTFDSMLGYHGHYEYLGKAAARLDDVLNILPSRLTALLIITLAPLFGGNRQRAYHMWRRDAGKTESPNAGHPMAAAAGALEIQLEKVNSYVLGDACTPITPAHIQQAERMVQWVGASSFLLVALVKLFLRFLP